MILIIFNHFLRNSNLYRASSFIFHLDALDGVKSTESTLKNTSKFSLSKVKEFQEYPEH